MEKMLEPLPKDLLILSDSRLTGRSFPKPLNFEISFVWYSILILASFENRESL